MELSLIDNRDAGEMERAVAAFAREPNGGQIVLGGFVFLHRELIITLAARHRLPTVYTERVFVTAGGLTSYGPDRVEQYRQAAGYSEFASPRPHIRRPARGSRNPRVAQSDRRQIFQRLI